MLGYDEHFLGCKKFMRRETPLFIALKRQFNVDFIVGNYTIFHLFEVIFWT